MSSALFNKKIWTMIAGGVLAFFALLVLFGALAPEAQAQNAPPDAFAQRTETLSAPPQGLACWAGVGQGGLQLDHCIALLSYYIFFVPATLVMFVAGYLFDTALSISLSSEFVNQSFVSEAWKAIRDVANLGFILTLIYMSVAIILGIETSKKFLVNLVIVALLLNFSAFFTKVVIDASNIFALEFYNAMGAPERVTVAGIEIPQRSLSSVFITGFDPQRLTGTESFQSWKDGTGGSVLALTFVFMGAAIITFFASFIMVKVAFLFIGRTVDFWYLIVVSPFAFVSYILPGFNYFGKWLVQLKDRALQAPIFMMGMYVIAKLIEGDFLKKFFGKSSGFLDTMLSTAVVFAVLYFAMNKLLEITEGYSGTAGSAIGKNKFVQGFAGKFGLTAGIGGMMARQPGRVAHNIAESDFAKATARKFPRIGGALLGGLDTAGGKGYKEYRDKQIEERVALGKRVAGEAKLSNLSPNAGRKQILAAEKSLEKAGPILKKKEELAKSYESFTVPIVSHLAGFIAGTADIDRAAAKKIRGTEPSIETLQEQIADAKEVLAQRERNTTLARGKSSQGAASEPVISTSTNISAAKGSVNKNS